MDFNKFSKTISYGHFETLDHGKPVWIFGAGGFARSIAKVLISEGFQVYGFVVLDPKEKTLLDLPIVSWKDVTWENVQLAMSVFSHNVPYTKMLAEAQEHGFSKVFMPWELYAQFKDQLGWRYWLTPLNYITDHLPEIQNVYNLVEDEESRSCLLNALLFRVGLANERADYKSKEPHYFNKLSLSKFKGQAITLIDGGAYTGDTYQDAINATPIETAFLFEPDPKNFSRLTHNVGGNAICYPLALADTYKILTFASDVGPSSAVVKQGDIHIAAGAIDELFPKRHIDFIKLDIEGCEADAIRGAEQTIKRERPVLVMAGYHKPGDLWELPLLLNAVCKNYKFYIRQHDYNSFESVVYAIPN
jgi:FkbM family methyltransferase